MAAIARAPTMPPDYIKANIVSDRTPTKTASKSPKVRAARKDGFTLKNGFNLR